MGMDCVLALGMAIATYYTSYLIKDEVIQLAALLGAIVFLLLSIVFAAWLIKLAILLISLVWLNQVQRNKRVQQICVTKEIP